MITIVSNRTYAGLVLLDSLLFAWVLSLLHYVGEKSREGCISCFLGKANSMLCLYCLDLKCMHQPLGSCQPL